MSKKRRAKKIAAREDAAPTEEVLAEGSGRTEIPPEGEVAIQVSSEPIPEDAHAGEAEVASTEAVEAADGTSAGPEGHEPVLAADGEQLEEIEDGEGLSDGEAAVLPTSAASMDDAQLKCLVEALVFASDKPLTIPRLRQLTRVGDIKRLEQALAQLATDYEARGLILHAVSGGYQFRTRPQFSVWVQQLIAGRPVRLSRAQLETLAIVAYRQPITRPEIDDIRGVDSSATLKLLLDRALIRVLGKKEEVGRPMLYGTTKEFLDFFSLGDLRELPTLREYSELSEESRKVMSARLGIAPDDGGSNDGDGGSGTPGSDPGDTGPMGTGSKDVGFGAEAVDVGTATTLHGEVILDETTAMRTAQLEEDTTLAHGTLDEPAGEEPEDVLLAGDTALGDTALGDTALAAAATVAVADAPATEPLE